MESVLKVLIALDYNPTAQKIAEKGYSMAKAMKAEITLLHVVSDPVYYSSLEYSPIMGFNGFLDPGLVQVMDAPSLMDAALDFLEKSKEYLGDNSIKTMVLEGDFADMILNAANTIQADFIVLGTHSRKWLENVITGSVTESLLRHSPIPLFIIPTKKTESD